MRTTNKEEASALLKRGNDMIYTYSTDLTTGRKYKIYNGTAYDMETPDEVVGILDRSIQKPRTRRLRLFFGDVKTGKDWNEEYDNIGYIGRSSGTIKIPLLIKLFDSSGGGAISDGSIVKITRERQVLYQHPTYSCGNWTSGKATAEGYKYGVYRDGEIFANFKDNQADKVTNFILFMRGRRNSK